VKIARFEDNNGQICYGIVSPCGCEAEVISGDIFGSFTRTGRTVKVKKFLSPVDPPNVIAIGLNYRDHAAESGMAIPELPLVFLKANTSVVGNEDAIVRPKHAPNEVDYEAELTIVIGKKAKDVEVGQVNDYILGYTCGNDVSARDCQLKIDKQWARGKSFDTFCPLGPWIVTRDEIDPSNLAVKTLLNGEVVQNSRTAQLIFNVPELVSFLSKQMTLLPGTVIMTGTPPGVGFSYKPPKYLKAGDEVIVEIEGIGQLKNRVE
jgi:2-keto-4-pentenoate hydratase/2-oxohepta-3-ene-1,7-dioic acid hydratase in catechol pathway